MFHTRRVLLIRNLCGTMCSTLVPLNLRVLLTQLSIVGRGSKVCFIGLSLLSNFKSNAYVTFSKCVPAVGVLDGVANKVKGKSRDEGVNKKREERKLE